MNQVILRTGYDNCRIKSKSRDRQLNRIDICENLSWSKSGGWVKSWSGSISGEWRTSYSVGRSEGQSRSISDRNP
jgi:hypothetical protein